jgi:hypothetical protein
MTEALKKAGNFCSIRKKSAQIAEIPMRSRVISVLGARPTIAIGAAAAPIETLHRVFGADRLGR